MDPITLGMLGGVALPALATFLNHSDQDDNRHEQRLAQQAQAAQGEKNAAMQKEFAQQGVRWKVEDARAAGIHPLAALGAATHSFAPSYHGPSAVQSGGSALAEGLSSMGQNVSRAAQAAQTQEERIFTQAMNFETLKNAQLKNKLLESQLTSVNNPMNPPLPSPMSNGFMPGQGGVPVEIKKAEITASDPGRPAKEAGAINDYSYVRTDSGYGLVPSKQAKERTEDDLVQQVMWAIRNQFNPRTFFGGKKPPDPKIYPPPPGKKWAWSPYHQQYIPVSRYHGLRPGPPKR